MHIHQLNIQLQFPSFILSQVLVHMTDSRIEGKIDGRNWNDPIPDLLSISISEIRILNSFRKKFKYLCLWRAHSSTIQAWNSL